MEPDFNVILQKINRQFGNRSFIIDAQTSEEITYSHLISAAHLLGDYFSKVGLKRGQRIGIYLENCVEFVILYFTCLFKGYIAVPINVDLHENDVSYILEVAKLDLLIYSNNSESPFKSIPEKIPPLIGILENNELIIDKYRFSRIKEKVALDPQSSEIKIDASNLWSLHFTSGTTAKPKGVFHSASSLLISALEFNKAVSMNHTDRIYHIFSMAYMAGFLNTLVCPFLAGGCVVLGKPFTARTALTFWKPIISNQVNRLWLVPSILQMLLKIDRSQEGKDWSKNSISSVLVGTAPLSKEVKLTFQEQYSTTILESYGLSECLFIASNSLENDKVESVGQVLNHCKVQIQDGEIMVQSKSMMRGYLDTETGYPATVATPFATGDIGNLKGNFLFVTDRKKDLIIKGGYNISPRKIESFLLEHPLLSSATVLGIPNEVYGEEIIAVVEYKNSNELSEKDLINYCRNGLTSTETPAKFLSEVDLPRNLNGKIDKRKLRKIIVSRLEAN